MEREKVITLLRLVKENGLKLDIAADEICSLFNVVGQSEQLSQCKCGNAVQVECDDCKDDRIRAEYEH